MSGFSADVISRESMAYKIYEGRPPALLQKRDAESFCNTKHRIHAPSSRYVRVDIPQEHSAPRASLLSGLARSAGSAGPYARAVRPGNRGVAIYGHGCGVNSSKAGSAAPPLLMRPPRDRLARHGPASTSSWSMPVLIRAYSPPSSSHLPLLAAASSAASCGTCVWIQETKRSQARCGRL